MHQLYAKSLGKPCGYVPFFLESLKCGGFARSKPSLYRERWSVTRIKDKYYHVQFRTTENKTNYSPGKNFSPKMTRKYRKRWYMGLRMSSRPFDSNRNRITPFEQFRYHTEIIGERWSEKANPENVEFWLFSWSRVLPWWESQAVI